MRIPRSAIRLVVAAMLLALPVAPRADTFEEKAQLCSACHGENGIPPDKSTPVIWGQHQGYLYLQLRDYKRGTRKDDVMSPVVELLKSDDMIALAEYYSHKRWPDLRQTPAPAARGGAGAGGQRVGRLHQLSPFRIPGRWNPAAACRPDPGLARQVHARLPQPHPRQQSRHVRSHERDFGGGYRGGSGVSGGAVSFTACAAHRVRGHLNRR